MIIFEIIFITILGCTLHFTYGWSNYNKFVGWFSATNESTWEHIKLALLPAFLTIPMDYWMYGSNVNYFFAKFLMFASLIILIPVLFYGVKAVFKKTTLIVDIIIFILSVIGGVLVFGWALNMSTLGMNIVSILGMVIIFIMFSSLTYHPINSAIFVDPISGKLGPQKYKCIHHHHEHTNEHKK